MEDMSLHLDKGESISIGINSDDSSEGLSLFIHYDGEVSATIQKYTTEKVVGGGDIVSINYNKGEVYIKTPHDIDIKGRGDFGQIKAVIKERDISL